MYSVEDCNEYIGKYQSNYIFAPTTSGWYDLEALKNIPESYQMLLVDGPHAQVRSKILDHIKLFNWNVKLVIDDYQESYIKEVADRIVNLFDRPYKLISGYKNKLTMVVP